MVGFHKVLDYRVILIITINSILGSGLFLYPAMGALYAGPSSILSWIILSIVVVYISMLFAEMVSMYPKAGGVYEFCKQAYGPFWGFVVGWMAWIIGNMMVALLLVGAVQYLIPSVSLMAFAIKAGISIAWLLIFNWLAYRGTQTSVFMLVLFSVITIIVTFSLIIPGLFFADPSNLQPFFIHEGLVNIWMILLALFFIHGAFFGLEAVMFLSEETKRPEKELPKALMHGTLVTAALTILLVIVSMSVLDHSEFADAAAPFTHMAGSMLGGGFQAFIMVGIYFALVGAAALWVVTGPRLIVALTRDRMFPPKFGAMHPVYNSPSKAIVFQLIVTSALVLLALVGGYDTLMAMIVPLVLIMITATVGALFVLRVRKPHVKRPYKAPFGKNGAAAVVLFNMGLVIVWLITEADAFSILNLCFSFILISVPIYFFLQAQYNPTSIGKVNDMLAYLTLYFERFLLTKGIRREIVKHVGDLQGKTIFEFGCSVGTLTASLAEEVGPYGRIYATDFSSKSVGITKSRMMRNGYMHVETLHDHKHSERIHPDVPAVDVITSINVLSTVEKIDQVLSDMNARLESGKPICFVEYDKFFHVINNINWLGSDAMIKHIFRRNGFLVNVTRKRGYLWETVFIYGKKVMSINYKPQDETIDLEEVYQDLKTFEGLYDLVKDYVIDFKDKILANTVGFIFSSDKELDKKTFSVNMKYFEKIFNILFDVGFHYCPEEGDIIFIVEKQGDDLVLRMLSQMEPHVIVIFADQVEEEGYEHRERKRDISYLRRLVQLGYKGEMSVTQIEEDHIPSNYHQYRQLIVGEYEETVIEKGAPFLKIEIKIPMDRIQS